MTRAQASHIGEEISSLIPKERIESLARETGVVRRLRKFGIVEFIWALTLGFARARGRSLEGFRRCYLELTGCWFARSSFYGRFTPALSSMLKQLALEALESSGLGSAKAGGALSGFSQVLAADSCIMKIHDSLRQARKGVWHPASLKVTAVMNVVGRGLLSYSTHGGSAADVRILRNPKGLKDKLLIFDLGFYQTLLFGRIDAQGGYFLSRLKKRSHATIASSYRQEHSHLHGKSLRDELKNIDEQIVDVTTEVSYVDHLIGKRKRQKKTFRVIAVFNEQTGAWHRYITNVPPELLAAEHVTAAYAARWEIELLFRELQSDYRLNQFPSRNIDVIESLISATVLSLVVSRKLRRFVAEVGRLTLRAIPLDRWGRLFRGIASQLLALLIDPKATQLALRLTRALVLEAPDPNRKKRTSLIERAEKGYVFA